MSTYLSYDQLIAQNPELDSQLKEKEWREKRRGRFTASEVQKLLTGKYKIADNDTARGYIMEKAAEKLGAYAEPVNSKQMSWGNGYEQEAIAELRTWLFEFEVMQNKEFIPMGDWSGATPDSFILENGKQIAIAQIKCPYNPIYHLRHLMLKTAEDLKNQEPEYYTQVQVELMASRVDFAYFVSYDSRFEGSKKLHMIKIGHDKDLQKTISEAIILASNKVTEILKLV